MVCDQFLRSTTAPTLVLAHEAAWITGRIAHCDISPGNIQIHRQRGILADWEYAVSIDQLHTVRAVNLVGFYC
jgi:RIO-like serine/threonine protein kinase